MLEGLQAIPWHTLVHGYGPADKVPVWIRQLTSTEERVRQGAIEDLGGSICHQGMNCEMTVYVVPFLVELLQEASVEGKEDILELLADIHAAEPPPVATEKTLVGDARQAVAAHFPLYLTFLNDPDIKVRMASVSLLSTFKEKRSEVSGLLKELLQRDLDPREKAHLLFALGEILGSTDEEASFF